ncbi:MAG: alanine--glyoxylate aminotransferase family protein [Candidatus Humimicrobiaceae bacterium]|jgi:aspartate aminotransferase-like enzyme|nr:alanine--glyoxylate aminotransferase family protein [Actinomycetota bacterium]MDY0028093.1 alanine--glyoxylate aminotransferase family protein [Candidatus Humimicrobiaceae bacterium]
MIKKYIMTPGPTAISEEVLLEHARPLMHHRSPEFSKIFIEVTEKLKKLFKTQNDLFILTSSGTGAMEASVVNFFSTGDKVLVASIGNFGERFKKICTRYGLNVIALDYEWGDAANPDDIKNALDDNPDIKGVLLQFSETSTGALNDIETIGNIVKKYPAILIVDAISGLGASNLETDNWGLDVVIGGSQKALSAPTGVAFISVSEKAWKLNENANLPRFYFDLGTARSYAQKTPPQTPWTPGISIIVAMNKALDMMFDEGLEKVFERHRVLSLAVQRAIEKIGLKPLVKDKNKRGFSVTSIEVPEGIEAKEITKIMRVKYGVTIAGGQGKLTGKIIRIGNLGYCGIFDVIIAISALEITLKELGYEFEPGSGVAEAEKTFIENNYLNS